MQREAPKLSLSLSPKFRFRFITFDELIKKRHHFFISNSAIENGEQNAVVNAVEEFPYITFEGVTSPAIVVTFFSENFLESCHSSMTTFSYTTRKRIGDEYRFKNRIKHTKDRMMQNPISHYRFMDMSALWICDKKSAIGSMFVRTILQFSVQFEDIWFKIHLEFKNIRAGPFATLEFFPRKKEIFYAYDFIK